MYQEILTLAVALSVEDKENIVMKILIILFCIVTTLAVLWMIGVPIYMKIKKKNLWTSCYTLGFSLFAVAINLINLIIQILS